MSKKKGLSVEEKRTRLLELFHEKVTLGSIDDMTNSFKQKDVFLLKELEKIAPKEKGIVSQSVKDVLTSLVADDLVETDKIGSSTFFWSFPSKALNSKMQKIKEMETKISESEKRNKYLDSELEKCAINETEMAARDDLLKQIRALETKRDELKAQLELKKDYDPELLNHMKNECNVAKQAVIRWTDNVFTVKSWLKDKYYCEESQINTQFGIPEDFDYPE